MRIRVQPLEIEVPKDNPFKNDLLDRKEQVEILTNIVSNIEGPCVLAVDAAWGTGKTTFIKIWEQFLRNNRFPVVRINAWETDYIGDPFVALTSELAEGLSGHTEPAKKEKVDAFKASGKKVLRRVGPEVLRLLASPIPLAGPVIGNALATYAEEVFTEYPKTDASIKEFRETLQTLASTLSNPNKDRPLVVFIDELDRCRPTYAIELLEVAKHLFAVDNMVFVLAVNREQLAHSVKAVYGTAFDADGYLSRFFDADFRLQDPDRTQFITGLLHATEIHHFLESSAGPAVSALLLSSFRSIDLGLRDIAQAAHRLGMVFLSLANNQSPLVAPAIVLLLLRTIDRSLYQRFVGGTATDAEVVDALYARIQDKEWCDQQEAVTFEGLAIVAGQEFTNPNWEGEPFDTSPLLESYRTTASDGTKSTSEKIKAEKIIRLVKDQASAYQDGTAGAQRFRAAAQRLELLSPDLSRFTEEEPS